VCVCVCVCMYLLRPSFPFPIRLSTPPPLLLSGETLQAKLQILRDGEWGALGDDWLARVRASVAVAAANHDVAYVLQARRCLPAAVVPAPAPSRL